VEADEYLTLGKIVGVHGVKGTLKIHSYAESPSIFQPGILILLRQSKGEGTLYPIRWAKPHGKGMLLSLEGIDERSRAESLTGCAICMKKGQLPEPEEDAFYWSDLIGISVVDTRGVHLGRVTSIIPTGSNDVYVVRSRTDEILIPALRSVVREIDLAAMRMTVALPEGL